MMMKKINEMLKNKCKLLYLVNFGSVLYGTNTNKSDIDLKGIFLPNLKDLILGNKCETINYSSENNFSRNSSCDLDISLWSLHKFLKLLSQGDTGALDLLFSFTYPSNIHFKDISMDVLFNNYLEFFNPNNTIAYVGYCMQQTKKYGIKDSRLCIIKNILEFIEKIPNKKLKLSFLKDEFNDLFVDGKYCKFEILDGGVKYIRICGSFHMLQITIEEFYNRIKIDDYNKYGERTKLTEENKGIDWKALSHAYRCIVQTKELLNTGKIIFPLKSPFVDEIMKIKLGCLSWEEVENLIINGLDCIDIISKSVEGKYKNPNTKFINNFILSFYENQFWKFL